MKKRFWAIVKEKNIITFSIVWLVFSFVLACKNYASEVGVINSSMMAFSYKYGFISRGFVGTLYKFLNKFTPFELMDYESLLKFTTLVAIIFVLIMYVFFFICIFKCSEFISEEIKCLIFFYSIFSVPMFFTYENLGRFDVYCAMFSLFAVILLLLKKAEFLIVILSAMGVLVHQGNVFMFLNIILVLLLYNVLSETGKVRIKYAILLGASFLVASILFIYFEFFSHSNGTNIYTDIIETASALGKNGDIHIDVIDHEILGTDVSSREYIHRLRNCVEFVVYVLLMSPYVLLGIKFFKNIISSATSLVEKWKYVFIAIGAGTMVPMLLLKCDYGRWMFAIITYYFVVIIALLGMKDSIVEKQIISIISYFKDKKSISMFLFIYPFLLTPFEDVEITSVVSKFADVINELILHWW